MSVHHVVSFRSRGPLASFWFSLSNVFGLRNENNVKRVCEGAISSSIDGVIGKYFSIFGTPLLPWLQKATYSFSVGSREPVTRKLRLFNTGN